MKRVITALGLILPLATSAVAQQAEPQLQFGLNAGVNIGATAPIPVPKAINRIYGWNPKFNPSVGVWATYRLGQESNWAISSGLQFERKTYALSAELSELPMKVRTPNGDIPVSFTGDQHLKMNNYYLTLPLTASYLFNGGHFRVHAGGYASLNLHKEFTVDLNGSANTGRATLPLNNRHLDFDEYIRPLDLGLRLGGDYYFNKHWAVNLRVDYALTRATKKSFYASEDILRHVYAFVGVSYRLK